MSGDPDLKRILQEVFAEDDRQRAEFEYREAQREQKQQALQRERGELVYKQYQPPKQSVQQQQQPSMTPEQQKPWDAWANQKIKNALAAERAKMGDAIARTISAIRQEWQGEIKKAIDDFKLPVLQGWTPRHYLKGSIVVSGGGLHQARENTAHPPGHHSWSVIVCPGEQGQDGMGAAELNAKLERRLVDLELKLGALIVDRAFERGDDKVVDLPDFRRRGHG
jgi:hypothetical protein